jgi:hypothetical protein
MGLSMDKTVCIILLALINTLPASPRRCGGGGEVLVLATEMWRGIEMYQYLEKYDSTVL